MNASAYSNSLRVAQGACIVAQKLVDQNRSVYVKKIEKATYHARELVKALLEIRHDVNLTNCTKSNGGANPSSSSNSSNSSNSTSPTVNSPPPPFDPTGFSSIPSIDMASTQPMPPSVDRKAMKESEVPSTQFARVLNFGSLATRMAMGVATDNVSRAMQGDFSRKRSISDDNAEVLAEALCRMRGAALKIGQILSLQDEDVMPPALSKALERVKQAADYMPKRQLEQQLVKHLGDNWMNNFKEFDHVPIAAASIGQVHRAVLLDGTIVAMKIQYPGVADSIESDLNNLKNLVTMTNILPRGLFIDQIIKVASDELAIECDYETEAQSQMRYRELVVSDKWLSNHVSVPQVFPNLTTKRVLTSAFVEGVAIDKAISLPQSVRNAIARTTLILTIRELFEWRFIQSDPNFGNFLYDHPNKTINLIDFGAAREYKKSFVDGYLKLVWAAANKDKDTILRVSKELGFLTGDESEEMINAHCEAGFILGEVFASNEPFDFSKSNLSKRIGKFGETFMKYRLTAPPVEAYSLHRKLAGAFMLAIKLKANMPCRDILEDAYRNSQV